MEVKVAKSAGFCFGVKRAVDMALTESGKSGNIYSFGPIIHNESVTEDLEKKGVIIVNSLEELENKPKGTVIIRSHGVKKNIYDAIINMGHGVLDATCPFVKKIHNAVSEYTKKGYHIIITGDKAHPEVEGITGWCDEGQYTVISEEGDYETCNLSPDTKICVVSQTTFKVEKFEKLVEIIRKKGYHKDICILNTICNATEERQTEAADLADASDAMIVIGSKNSSNTRKLYEICISRCKDTYYIQTLEDLLTQDFSGLDIVGITAGASTPNNIIQEVQKYVRNEL